MHELQYLIYVFDLEKVLSCWFGLVLCICLYISVCMLVAHLLLTYLSLALSAQSYCPTENDPFRQAPIVTDLDTGEPNCPLSSRTQVMEEPLRRLTRHETHSRLMAWKSESCWPHMLSHFLKIHHPVSTWRWACHVSDLRFAKSSIGDWEAESDSEHKFKASLKWRWLSQGQHTAKGM